MRASFLLPLVTAAALLALARPAHADDPAIPPPPPLADPEPVVTPTARAEAPPPSPPRTGGRTQKQWYGWETILADSASVVVFALGANANDGAGQTPLLAGGLMSFAVATPLVHAAHGRWGMAVGDVGIRAGAVLVGSMSGALLGAALGSGPSNQWGGTTIDGAESGLLVGAVLGALSASVLDAAVFARERVKPEETETAAFTWGPSLRPVREGAVAGVAGTF